MTKIKVLLAILLTLLFCAGGAYVYAWHLNEVSNSYFQAHCENIDLYYDSAMYRESIEMMMRVGIIAEQCIILGFLDYSDLPDGLYLEGDDEEI